jgi:hypothetical protein
MNWYCTCKADARVLGMCAQITSVIWFLDVGRQLKNPRKCDFFAKLCIDANVSLIDALILNEKNDKIYPSVFFKAKIKKKKIFFARVKIFKKFFSTLETHIIEIFING